MVLAATIIFALTYVVIAIGRLPAPSMPRAVWSAAMSISRPDAPSHGRRCRLAAASATAAGLRALVSVMA